MAKATEKKAKDTASDTAKYSSGIFSPVIDKCESCERIIEVESIKYCSSYTLPAAKWRQGMCNFATHIKPEVITSKIKVNPLKASKRAMGK
ncbi:MAG: PxxKW family cysteine-rich protein [Proteobacteria bacterium]|nr:PxxKW family cysteine-rich protein [Pseudomonadota bacterium]MBU1714962.1 PxxKW family cysteine-rich protein [Pseudomonadota bacterium]